MQFATSARSFAIALVSALASTAAVADDMFLKFSDTAPGLEIIGDSTDPQHPNEIVLQSYSLGVEAESSWTKGGGASVGKPNPGELQFTTILSRAVPAMFKYITTGKNAPVATLTVRSSVAGNRAGHEYAKYTFTEVYFTNIAQGLSGAGRAVSAISAVYKTAKLEQFVPGNPAAVSCVEWNIPSGNVVDCS